MQPEGLQQVVQVAYMKTFWLPRNQAHHLQSIAQIPQYNDPTW